MAFVQSTNPSRSVLRRRLVQTVAGYTVFALSFGFAVALVCGLIR